MKKRVANQKCGVSTIITDDYNMKTKLCFFTFLWIIANCILPSISGAQSIAGGGIHSLALCSDNTVKAWGDNFYYQLGDGTTTSASNVPVPVSSLTGVIALSGGGLHSLALRNDSTVWAWGRNLEGQMGNGVNTNSNIPIMLNSFTGVTAIAAGGYHSLGLKKDSTVWAWGSNTYGQLGNGTTTASNVPVQVSSLSGIIAITAGLNHCLALKGDGTVWAWGRNFWGQLGDGTTTDRSLPVQVGFLSGITAVAAGKEHSLALKNDGTVWAAGDDSYGQLGNGNNTISTIFVAISSLTGITSIASGGSHHSLALKNDSTVWAWGRNNYGQLGNGTNINSNVPVAVNSLTGAIAIAKGEQHSMALKSNGSLWAWGNNSFSGALGDGTYIDRNVPVQVVGLCQMISAVNDIASEPSFSVFPNPSGGVFVIDSKIKGAEITIFNSMGEIATPVSVLTGRSDHAIDLSSHPNGIYFIRMKSKEGRIITSKIIIQK